MSGKQRGLCDGVFVLSLLIVSGLLGMAWNVTRGERSAWTDRLSQAEASIVSDIDLAELRRAIGSILLLDAREPGEFAAGHLPEAMNLPWNISEAELTAEISKLQNDSHPMIVVYCAGVMCEDADRLAARLTSAGKPIRIYRGGWEEWEANP